MSGPRTPMAAWPALAGVLLLLAGPALAQETPAYVGSATCGACHETAKTAWEGSHHALAWTLPSAGTVVADFDGTTFTHDGMTARFRIAEDGTYHVAVTEKDGSESDYDVKGVVGIEPLQQYLLETEPGRLQSFDVVWDTEGNRWFHLYPDQDLPPDDGLHWTGPYKNWNGRCAVCHATGFDKKYDGASRTFASTEAEIGVGCEACHGPGAAHVAWAEGREMPASAAPLDAIGLLAALDSADTAMDVCGACHARREPFSATSTLPGSSFHDSHNLSLLREGLYHADGQILDEVYVLGSFLQSKMAARGVTCTNCHDPHTAELRAPGNAVCTQCHNPVGRPDFPTLRPADYDSPAHHFHTPGTAGAECKSCHMVERVYMGNDWRADHSFRIPRPDLAAETGAPDACTTCHTDRSPEWAAAEIAARYPDARNRGPHFGTVLARGRRDPAGAADDLAALAEDTAAPGIARATAMSLLGGASDAALAARLRAYLGDRDPLVRSAAVGVQRLAAPQDRVLALLDSLADPVRAVRIAAARALLDAPIARLPSPHSENFSRAMGEWQAALAANRDFPETHLQLGGFALVMRNAPAASAAFREVVLLDPQRIDAWVMRARIAAATEGAPAARAILEEGLARNPGEPTLKGMLAQIP